MASDNGSDRNTHRRQADRDDQAFILSPLLQNVRLAGDDGPSDTRVNCVEYWGKEARWSCQSLI